MELTLPEATILRAVAVCGDTAFATRLMELAKIASSRFYALAIGLENKGLLDNAEEAPTPASRPARYLYSLTASGANALVHGLMLPPAQTQQLRPGRTLRLQVAPTKLTLATILRAYVETSNTAVYGELLLEGGQSIDPLIHGLVFDSKKGRHTFHGTTFQEGKCLGYIATVKASAPHPADSELDMVFGTVRFRK